MTKLYRSQRDKKILGLCGGLAEAFNIDATLFRLIFVFTVFFSGGAALILYALAALVIPKEPAFDPRLNPSPSFSSGTAYASPTRPPEHSGVEAKPDLDEMMKDVEKKAMMREIDELKAKLKKFEEGDENS